MSENIMDALLEVLKPCPTGARLAAALKSANLASSDLPLLIKDVITEIKAGSCSAGAGGGAAVTAERLSLAEALCVLEGLMFLSPRGKQQLALFADRCVVKTAKADITVPYSAIQHLAIIDSIPGDTKGKVLLYLHIASEHRVMNGKTPLTAIVIQTTADAQLDVAHPQGGGRLQGAAPVVVCQALGAVPGGVDPTCFVSPDSQYFQSAAKATGVGAYVKARQGFLYPLPTALCFLEAPALFIPHASIRSMELMRAGGSSSTFDLVVHCRSGAAHEFTMVSRAEIGGIEDYIRKCRLAVGAAESSDEDQAEGGKDGSTRAAAAAADSDEDSDDPEDEDFNPAGSSSSEDKEEGGSQQQQRQQQGSGTKRKRDGAAAGGEQAGSEAGSDAAGADDGDSSGDGSGSSEEEESSSDEDSDSDDGDVELVSEDDFSTGQLHSMIASEASGGGGCRPKRQRS